MVVRYRKWERDQLGPKRKWESDGYLGRKSSTEPQGGCHMAAGRPAGDTEVWPAGYSVHSVSYDCCFLLFRTFLRQDLSVAQAGMRLVTSLPQPAQCLDYRCESHG